ncbi:unnamed protein product [Cunninghamella echinulata]
MAEAMINGLIKDSFEIRYVEPNTERRQYMKQHYPTLHGSRYPDETILNDSNMIILSVKPQHLPTVIPAITPFLQKQQPKPLLVSIASGITIEQMISWMQKKIEKDSDGKVKNDVSMTQMPIVRCMPNTAAFIGESAIGLFATEHVSQDQRQLTEKVMHSIAKKVIWVENEDLIHAVTAISGSGPAYFFLIMEAMKQAGIDIGLTPEDAETLTIQTCLGAALMAKTSDDDLSTLRKKVTSPNGTTEAAIQLLEKDGIRKVIKDAVLVAQKRSEELSEELKD